MNGDADLLAVALQPGTAHDGSGPLLGGNEEPGSYVGSELGAYQLQNIPRRLATGNDQVIGRALGQVDHQVIVSHDQ